MINRIIAPMLIKDGVLVQSKKYQWHLPIGHIEQSAIQLQYFKIDEFMLISLDGMANSCIDIDSLERLRKVSSSPISYAGGVCSLEQLRIAFDVGADRVVINRMLNHRISKVEAFVDLVGRQGGVGSFDITVNEIGECFVRTIDHVMSLDVDHIIQISSIVGEINLGLIDFEGVNKPMAYKNILCILSKLIQKINCPITIYGGSSWLDYHNLIIDTSHKVSISVDNIFSYKEDSVNEFRKRLKNM